MSLNVMAGGGGGDVAKSAAASKVRIKEISLVIKQNPQNAQAFAERAAAKLELGDAFGAIKDYNNAVEIAPSNTEFLQARGNAFVMVEAFKEALTDFNTALLNSTSLELIYDRAVAKFHLDDYEGALADLNQVLAAAPSHSKALFNRAVVKLDMQQTEGAIADLTTFLASNPNHEQALFTLELAKTQLAKKVAKR
ncbi:tetratricopeptide repeat protein [Rufibacter sp. LB8]|uniref:tetratricopeptide repeat protein n=1 Tax=Rufibacter sp. LB8 TaxID=2777781 RepID=UPI00178C6115|nr:tetratricopeptide repeat protein [Rufibacter sp. LB8]